MINPMDLTGRHIVVTGASSGIGAETARQITRLGGRVSLIARREDKLREVVESLDGQRGKYYPLDLSNTEEIAAVIDRIFKEQGAFDGGVYAAGQINLMPLKMIKPKKLREVAEVNYFGFVEFVRCITLKKYRAENMSVVGVSSVNANYGDKSNTIYSSTKAAMNGAMRAMAREFAEYDIRVNNVLPGLVHTELTDQIIRDGFGAENYNKTLETNQYIGKFLEPIDVANAVCFLLSGAARYITGTEMLVNGGCLC